MTFPNTTFGLWWNSVFGNGSCGRWLDEYDLMANGQTGIGKTQIVESLRVSAMAWMGLDPRISSRPAVIMQQNRPDT